MIAQQQEEWFVADEFFRLVDGMSETLGGVLLGEMQPLAESAEFFRFDDRPVLAAEGLDHVVVEAAEIFAVLFFLAGLGDDADLLDAGIDGFLADDLDDGLGEAVAIDQRKHFLLDGGGGGILARSATGGGDDGFADFGLFRSNPNESQSEIRYETMHRKRREVARSGSAKCVSSRGGRKSRRPGRARLLQM